MNYFLIAGEASGDLHASKLMACLRKQDAEARFAGLGGALMRAEGLHCYQDYREMAYMGIVAVVRNATKIRRNFAIAQEALLSEQPDVLVLVDYPGFNLRMAAFCRQRLPKTKIVYYIPPKCWAWKARRVHKIAQLSDEVLGIFPFEPAFYAKYGYKCTYVGNPTEEELRSGRMLPTEQKDEYIAVLPGSRASEISSCIERMLEAARRCSQGRYPIVVTGAPGIDDSMYTPYLHEGEVLRRDTYEVVRHARAAIVNSGTATLETALLGCPQVSVYHVAMSRLIGMLRKRWQPVLFKIKYFTLVNIVGDKEIIKELVADDFTTDKVATELERLLHDEQYRQEMLQGYQHVRDVLGQKNAAEEAAQIVSQIASKR